MKFLVRLIFLYRANKCFSKKLSGTKLRWGDVVCLNYEFRFETFSTEDE